MGSALQQGSGNLGFNVGGAEEACGQAMIAQTYQRVRNESAAAHGQAGRVRLRRESFGGDPCNSR